jgi:periplasmic protein TonB
MLSRPEALPSAEHTQIRWVRQASVIPEEEFQMDQRAEVPQPPVPQPVPDPTPQPDPHPEPVPQPPTPVPAPPPSPDQPPIPQA